MKRNVLPFVSHSWLFLLKLRAQRNCHIQFCFIILFGKYAKYNKQFRVLATIWIDCSYIREPRTACRIHSQLEQTSWYWEKRKNITSNSRLCVTLYGSWRYTMQVHTLRWPTDHFHWQNHCLQPNSVSGHHILRSIEK